MRNPWGSHEWNGDWSDKSPLWTDKLKAELGYKDEDDGIFWMDINDFLACFAQFHICKYVDKYEFKSIKIGAS